jgi:hypothetical protein
MDYKIIALLVVCIALVAAAGCTGLQSTTSGRSSISQDSGNGGSLSEKTAYSGPASMPVPTIVPTQSGPVTTGVDTKIIKTAYLTIEVKDVPGAVETLNTLASQKGGYISSTNVQKNYNDRLSGSVILRVPAPEFDSTLAGVRALGTVKSSSTQGQDVTEEYVDIQAQKTSYQNQLAQYNEIMKRAVKVEDVITVQQQIDRVQTELNRLEGRLKYLNSRIDFSTITVNLEEPEPVGGDTGHNFVSTINEGIAGFFGMIDALIIVFFTLLPLVILGGAAYAVYRYRKGKKPEGSQEIPEKK